MIDIDIEIIFQSSSRPKRMTVEDIYTKAGFVCLQCADGLIVRYPMMNIFSICSKHGPHLGSCRDEEGRL